MKLPNDELTWSEVISRTLMDLARKDKNIVAITPAMAQGSKLLDFEKAYPIVSLTVELPNNTQSPWLAEWLQED